MGHVVKTEYMTTLSIGYFTKLSCMINTYKYVTIASDVFNNLLLKKRTIESVVLGIGHLCKI